MNTRFFKYAIFFGMIGAIATFVRIIYYSVFAIGLTKIDFYYIRYDEDFIPKMICISVVFSLTLYMFYTLYKSLPEHKNGNGSPFRNVISAIEYLLITVSVATAFFTLISAHKVSEIAIALAITAAVASICLLFHKAVKKSIDSIMRSTESDNGRRIHPLLSLLFVIIFIASLSTIAFCVIGLFSNSTAILFSEFLPCLTGTGLTIFEICVQLPIMISSLLFIVSVHSFKHRIFERRTV